MRRRFVFLSNMFPSALDPTYGVFVERNLKQLLSAFDCSGIAVVQGRLVGVLKLWAYIKFFVSSIWVLSVKSYDFVYCHYLTYTTIPLLLMLPFIKRPYIINVHGDDLMGSRIAHKIMGYFSPVLLKRASLIVVPSRYFKCKLLEIYPHVNPEVVFVSESAGVDRTIFKPAEINFKPKYFSLAYVSRIDEGKGWEVFLLALHHLRSYYNDACAIKATFVGGGREVERFTKAVRSLGLEGMVEYRGAVEHALLPEIFLSADYLVFPTERESLGLVAIESMSCGTPVIASHIAPLTDYIRNFENGFLFEVNNFIALASTIECAIEVSEDVYMSLVRNALIEAHKYSADEVRDRLVAEINGVNKACR